MALYKDIMPYFDFNPCSWLKSEYIVVASKIWTPQNFTIANFRHPVSRSWLRPWSILNPHFNYSNTMLILWIKRNTSGRQLPSVFAYRIWMTSYHVRLHYNISIGIKLPNNEAHFNRCRLQICAEYTLIYKLSKY